MSASWLRDALNAKEHAALQVIYRVLAKRPVNRLDKIAPNIKALRDAMRPGKAREHIHNQARLIADAGQRGGGTG